MKSIASDGECDIYWIQFKKLFSMLSLSYIKILNTVHVHYDNKTNNTSKMRKLTVRLITN